MDNNIKQIVSFARLGKALEFKSAVLGALSNKMSVALDAKKLEVSKQFVSKANDNKRN